MDVARNEPFTRVAAGFRGGRGLAAFPQQRALFLSGPEGGLSDAEEDAAGTRGFVPVTLGPRVLRADTAPLAVLAWLALSA